ncbi:tRNA dihydrouridine(16) synthase DusC [Permianibacter sp. IMCC34836]|uniref:tRNA-dihydrouridine synthase n=1 Tax=Permianibacter fluminis TaxID=2738515 RepID=UPI0015541B5A|nr:tRNA-dihydrouridine synthase [Permianibacter fluminis]NQD37842.1 tRNA dihydrouridine(16) synthase DusC [Permianibacter fluminis]
MRILLAPMEGLLDHLLRDVLTRVGGVDLCIAEFIRVTDTLLPPRSFYRIVPELQNHSRTVADIPVRLQLLGSDPVCMAENAARAAELGACGIDLNFGCPAKTVNRHRGGAVLLKEPDTLLDIVTAVRAAVPAQIPVTAKMRLGYDSSENAVICAQALADGGASELTVHARTKMDGYRPPAYWNKISEIRTALTIPVIANGEIWTVEDFHRARAESGCIDVMLGRGMVANPALALMIRGSEHGVATWQSLQPLIHYFWQQLAIHIEPKYHTGRLKQWLNFLRRIYPEAEGLFNTIRTNNDSKAVGEILKAESTAVA